jgi:hypothetical protein
LTALHACKEIWMPNLNGDAYALTLLCPIINRPPSELSYTVKVREILDALPSGEQSPMACIPETYLCRLFVLDNVVYQGLDMLPWLPAPGPAREDTLKSAYLVFETNFHGPDLDPYLHSMWEHAGETIRMVWRYCVGFGAVRDAASFARYAKRCQVETTFFFNGSTDESLAEQLKGLYLKQELSRFAFEHQNMPAGELQAAFFDFIERTQPEDLLGPTWRAGASTLDVAVVDGRRPRPAPPIRTRPPAADNVQPAIQDSDGPGASE